MLSGVVNIVERADWAEHEVRQDRAAAEDNAEDKEVVAKVCCSFGEGSRDCGRIGA